MEKRNKWMIYNENSSRIRSLPYSYCQKNKIISGWQFQIVNLLIGLHVIWLTLKKFKNPVRAISLAARVIDSRKQFETTHPKIIKSGRRYYMNLHTPGWPSRAFDRSINHALNLFSSSPDISLFSIVFAITHKCGFHCEHCVEWDQLNQNDRLFGRDLVEILQQFYQTGISQVHLSGGEPLNHAVLSEYIKLPDL